MSSGYGKRLMFQRSWVRFPAPFTGWTFFTFICCKNCKVCLKRPKKTKKRPGLAHFFLKMYYYSRALFASIEFKSLSLAQNMLARFLVISFESV